MKEHFQKAKLIPVGVVAVVLLLLALLRPREPVYRGKTLSEWLENLDKEMPNSNYVGTNGPAATAVQQIGTNAIPYLRQMLDARDSRLKAKLITLSSKQTFVKIHITRADDWRRRAAFATFALGQRGSPLLPEVMSLFRDKDYLAAQTATTVLGCIGYCNPDTLPALIVALEDQVPGVRVRAAFALNQLNTCLEIVDVNRLHILQGSRCKAAVPALLTALNDIDSEVRRVAAMTLKQIDPEAAARAGVR